MSRVALEMGAEGKIEEGVKGGFEEKVFMQYVGKSLGTGP